MNKLLNWSLAACGLVACACAALPAAAQTAAPNWSGPYLGGSLGGRWQIGDWHATQYNPPVVPPISIPFASNRNASTSSLAARVGGYAGYNFQVAPMVVLGVEADLGWGDNRDQINGIPGMNNTTPPSGSAHSNVQASWDGSLRGRAGYLITPSWLLYGTGGLAFETITAGSACVADTFICNPFIAHPIQSNSTTTTQLGWTVGGGAEMALTPHLLLRAEYRYSQFQFDFTALPPKAGQSFGSSARLTSENHIASIGIAYKF